jgi:hypothetical protein
MYRGPTLQFPLRSHDQVLDGLHLETLVGETMYSMLCGAMQSAACLKSPVPYSYEYDWPELDAWVVRTACAVALPEGRFALLVWHRGLRAVRGLGLAIGLAALTT